MPYVIVPDGTRFTVRKKATLAKVSEHGTKADAEAAIRAIEANEHGDDTKVVKTSVPWTHRNPFSHR
jgi:hypothetical protein